MCASSIVRSVFASLALLFLLCAHAHAQNDYEYIHPWDTWKYVDANSETRSPVSTANFQSPDYDDTKWFSGSAPFGNTGGGDFGANTYWGVVFPLKVRKEFNVFLPSAMIAQLGVDNGYRLWVNGQLVSSAYAEGFTYRWEYTVSIPASVFVPGKNVVALEMADNGGLTAFDMRLVGPHPDALPPDTLITSGPASNSTICSPDVTITVSGSDNVTPTNQLQYQWNIDNQEWSDWTIATDIPLENLTDGLHTFSVRSKDGNGNIDPTPASRAFYVDTTAPAISNVVITVFPTEAFVEWDTDEGATAQIEFGRTDQYGNTTALDPRLLAHHRLRLSNPALPLHLRVRSMDACGHEALSQDYEVALTITNVRATVPEGGAGFTRASVLYDTSLAVSSHVEYGRSVFYNCLASGTALQTQHQVGLSDLIPSTTYHYRVKATRGKLTVYSEDYTFRTKGGSQQVMRVSGTITLQECVAQEQWIRFELRPLDNSEVLVLGARLSASGTYTLVDVPRKNYRVAIKGAKWLQKTLALSPAALGDMTGITASLLGGDANDDNSVDVFDLDLLIQNFDSSSADPFWDERADFNCDDSIDVLDLDLLIRNFDDVGEE